MLATPAASHTVVIGYTRRLIAYITIGISYTVMLCRPTSLLVAFMTSNARHTVALDLDAYYYIDRLYKNNVPMITVGPKFEVYVSYI